MPEIDQNELIVQLEWNENIHLDENRSRIASLMEEAEKIGARHTAYIGQQQFLLNTERELSVSEAELYFKTEKTDQIQPLQQAISQWIGRHYPMAVVSFAPPETVFEKLFDTGEADIVAELYSRNKEVTPEAGQIQALEKDIEQDRRHGTGGRCLRQPAEYLHRQPETVAVSRGLCRRVPGTEDGIQGERDSPRSVPISNTCPLHWWATMLRSNRYCSRP